MHNMMIMEIWGLEESKYREVVEELMRKKDENEENNENDKHDKNDENDGNDDTYTWTKGDVRLERGWTDESWILCARSNSSLVPYAMSVLTTKNLERMSDRGVILLWIGWRRIGTRECDKGC